jgi:glycerol-3-phosphate O-acyltransferase
MSTQTPSTYPFDYVIPELSDWPIHKMNVDRDAFMQTVFDFAKNKILSNKREGALKDQLAKVLYLERIRLIETPWQVDPPDEMDFWSDIKEKLIRLVTQENSAADAAHIDILDRVLWRYIREMMSNFQISTYKLARRVLPIIFDGMLNAANGYFIARLFAGKRNLSDKLQIVGAIPTVRSLVAKGTIVVVPTHFSNLDSILIGWAADRIGLTALSYGAGLNLYNTSILAHFFPRLGAYALDRRKKNNLYLETLKAYSQLSIERGVHSLFFPGGTRSRSGQLETKVKMGLLGTAIDAQCAHYQRGEDKKIFVVPLILNYHCVLEAKSLIDQFLEQTGKELYLVEKKAFGGAWNLLKFLWKFFSTTSEMVVSFGKPMDVLGNFVDAEGDSYDARGRKIDVKDYFVSEGRIKYDFQRNEEYTKQLANTLVKRFYIENIVLSSQLLAYTAFEIFLKQYPTLDFYGILRLPPDDRVILKTTFYKNISLIRQRLVDMEKAGKIQLSEIVRSADLDVLIEHGLKNVGTFHVKKALLQDKDGDITSEDMNLLYYYHNRTEGYGLSEYLEV